jgi:hypothetical protein
LSKTLDQSCVGGQRGDQRIVQQLLPIERAVFSFTSYLAPSERLAYLDSVWIDGPDGQFARSIHSQFVPRICGNLGASPINDYLLKTELQEYSRIS